MAVEVVLLLLGHGHQPLHLVKGPCMKQRTSGGQRTFSAAGGIRCQLDGVSKRRLRSHPPAPAHDQPNARAQALSLRSVRGSRRDVPDPAIWISGWIDRRGEGGMRLPTVGGGRLSVDDRSYEWMAKADLGPEIDDARGLCCLG